MSVVSRTLRLTPLPRVISDDITLVLFNLSCFIIMCNDYAAGCSILSNLKLVHI